MDPANYVLLFFSRLLCCWSLLSISRRTYRAWTSFDGLCTPSSPGISVTYDVSAGMKNDEYLLRAVALFYAAGNWRSDHNKRSGDCIACWQLSPLIQA